MQDTLRETSIFTAYLSWHYTKGLREMVHVFGNFLWFIAHFFSFKLLLTTLLKPWRRMGESYGEGLQFDKIFSALIVNMLMRIVGFVSRVVVIFVGLISYLIVFIFGLVIFLIWVFLPLLIVAGAVLAFNFFVI